MFGRDIRMGAVGKKEERSGLMGYIRRLLESIGFNDEQSTKVLSGEEPETSPETVAKEKQGKPIKRKYNLVFGKNFASSLDNVSLKASLFNKMKSMANFALDNDLVTGNIVFSSGMRSPKKAHRWSTPYQIREGKVPLEKLSSLPDGKDLDGNVWYLPGWIMNDANNNALKIWSGALAAEGYPKGDNRREPNIFKGGVTRHATGKAIDATFLWDWVSNNGQKIGTRAKIEQLKHLINKRWAKKPAKRSKVLNAINRFIGRGSYSALTYKTVEDFGLTRPVLHKTGSPEDWHYEEK